MILNELQRKEIIDKSKTNSRLNRYTRRSSVKDVSISRVGILEIMYLDQPDLDIYFIANGHRVSLRLLNFMDDLRKFYDQNYELIQSTGGIRRSKWMRRIVELTMNNSLNNKDIRISCSCPDFKYRFAYVATMNDYQFEEPQLLAPKITNPDKLGSGCKHIIRVLTYPSKWKAKVVTGVMSIIRLNPKLLDAKGV